MARRTVSIDDEIDEWVVEDLEYGDSYSAVVEDGLELLRSYKADDHHTRAPEECPVCDKELEENLPRHFRTSCEVVQ